MIAACHLKLPPHTPKAVKMGFMHKANASPSILISEQNKKVTRFVIIVKNTIM
jgi:hypothetical protein